MKRVKDVERMIANLRVEPGADASRRILADATAALAQAAQTTSQRAIRPRRIDMIRRHIGGFTAAAAAAVALIGMFFWLTGGSKPQMSAYAQVSEAASNTKSAKWVHMVSNLSSSMADTFGARIECWVSPSPSRLAVKRQEGLMFVDRANNSEYRYDYATKTVKVGAASDFPGDVKGTSDLFDDVMRSIDRMQKSGSKVVTKKGSRTIDGVSYDLYVCTDAGDDKVEEILVDPAARRIARFDTTGPGFSSSLVLDYPPTGPEDIYTLGAPRDAKIVQERETPAGSQFVIVAATGMGPIKWGMTSDEIQAALGPAERTSNVVPGKVLLLYYLSKGFTLTVYQTRGLAGITCCDKEMGLPFAFNAETFAGKTAEGIGIGSTEEAIVAAYGQPSQRETRGKTISLAFGGIDKVFTLHDGKVAQLSISSPRIYRAPRTEPALQATDAAT